MSIQTLIIQSKDGVPIYPAPYCQLIISEKQQVVVVGVDFDQIPFGCAESLPGIETRYIGKLMDQSILFAIKMGNALEIECWDFEAWPNPELIILTDNR